MFGIDQLIAIGATGYTKRFNPRKSLRVDRVTSVEFIGGCKFRLVAQITLKRKFRKNAVGTMVLTADLVAGNVNRINPETSLPDPCLCFENFNVEKFDLSNTLGWNERRYARFANDALGSMCLPRQ